MLTLKRFQPPVLPRLTGDWEKDGPNVIRAFNDVLKSVNDFLLSLEEKGALAITEAEISGTVGTGNLDLNGNDLVIDADADTYLHSTADDVARMVVGGSDHTIWNATGLGVGVVPSVKFHVSGDVRIDSGSLRIGTGGAYSAGAIYSDANWGMIFRAKQASPAQADFRWATSADYELMRLNSTGLGIGVAPSYKLHVNSGQIAAPDGSAAAPAYTFASSGNSDTGAYLSAADTYSIACGGVLVASFVQGTGLTAYSSIELLSGSANGRVKIRSSAHSTSPGTLELLPSSGGSVWAGVQSATSTSATDGFLYIPTCAGTPTGTPTTATGLAPLIVDTTNNKLYFYSGGSWRDAGP